LEACSNLLLIIIFNIEYKIFKQINIRTAKYGIAVKINRENSSFEPKKINKVCAKSIVQINIANENI
jgi:hypothetical protein